MQVICLLYLLIHTPLVLANTEKIIFLAPRNTFSQEAANIFEDLQIPRLNKSHSSVRDQLPVNFVTKENPLGNRFWYILEGLDKGRRYEVRACWAATVMITVYSI